jgi:hypothetical protein
MTDVNRLLDALEHGDPHAASRLLPRVYNELRKLAAQRMGREKPGQTLPATALVHEADLPRSDSLMPAGRTGAISHHGACPSAVVKPVSCRSRRLTSKGTGSEVLD